MDSEGRQIKKTSHSCGNLLHNFHGNDDSARHHGDYGADNCLHSSNRIPYCAPLFSNIAFLIILTHLCCLASREMAVMTKPLQPNVYMIYVLLKRS